MPWIALRAAYRRIFGTLFQRRNLLDFFFFFSRLCFFPLGCFRFFPAVTVRSTFLQNRAYLDYYYREAFTVVEMEAGPFCDAVYEIADVDRYPVGEAVNFSKLPIDFGIIHYASDTPYTQARTLGARGLSYFGMDSTYASSLAIVRRVLALEGVLEG